MSLDPDFLIPRLIVVAILLLVAAPVHEFAHAFAANQLGDGTARLLGRLTLDPRAHFDPVGGTLLIAMVFIGVGIGWAKPTPYNPYNLRGGRTSEALVAAAGPISNLVMASLAAIPLRYLDVFHVTAPAIVVSTLVIFVYINLALMVFNLLPIPPLDGSKLLYAALDERTERQWRPVLEQYGIVILLLAVFLPVGPGGGSLLGVVFDQIIDPIFGLLTGL